jgi:hypothetical protein
LTKALKKASSPSNKHGSPKGGPKKDDDSGSEYEVNARDFYAGGGSGPSRGII